MEQFLDVSMLEPCEPLERSVDAARKLVQGDFLHILHRQEPRLLFPLLQDSGYRWEKRFSARGHEIYVWRENDPVAEQQVRDLLAD